MTRTLQVLPLKLDTYEATNYEKLKKISTRDLYVDLRGFKLRIIKLQEPIATHHLFPINPPTPRCEVENSTFAVFNF